jgi:hypothetical protein
MLFHIKWPDGSLEDCVSECETRDGFINERFGEVAAFNTFSERGGMLQSDEEVQEEFKVFQNKLQEFAKDRPSETQEITKFDVGDLDALLGSAPGEGASDAK